MNSAIWNLTERYFDQEFGELGRAFFSYDSFGSKNASYRHDQQQSMKQSVDSIWSAYILVASILIPYLVTGFYVMYHDLSGHWVRYDLRGSTAPRRTTKNYLQSMPSQMFKIMVILPLSLYIGQQYRRDPLTLGTLTLKDVVPQICTWIGMFLFHECYFMAGHYVFHMPLFYRRIHKKHHAPLINVTALSTWNDTVAEYVIQDCVVLALLIMMFPVKLEVLMMYFANHGHSVSIGHSGFYINSWIDSRYHFDHHKNFNYNYADWEFLDWLFGTRWEEKNEAKSIQDG